jgi:hypothetical protein
MQEPAKTELIDSRFMRPLDFLGRLHSWPMTWRSARPAALLWGDGISHGFLRTTIMARALQLVSKSSAFCQFVVIFRFGKHFAIEMHSDGLSPASTAIRHPLDNSMRAIERLGKNSTSSTGTNCGIVDVYTDLRRFGRS